MWENYNKIQKSGCSKGESLKKRNKRSILGGHEKVEVGDKGILAAVEYVMKDYNAKRNDMFRAMPVDLLNVKKQVGFWFLSVFLNF